MSVVTVEDAKTHLGIDNDLSDPSLQKFLDRIESALADRIGPLAPAAETDFVRGWRTALQLNTTPVISLTSVTAVEGTTIPVSQLTPTPAGGRIEYKQGGYFASKFYTVVYQAGFSALPESLKLGVLELVRLFWEASQRGPLRSTGGNVPAQRIPAIPYAGFDEPAFNQLIDALAKPYRPILMA